MKTATSMRLMNTPSRMTRVCPFEGGLMRLEVMPGGGVPAGK